MTVCLAIDAGGTSTRALLIALDGTCVGYGRAGGGNPVSWGPDAASRSVTAAVAAALAQARSAGSVPPAEAGPVALAGPAVLAMAGSSAAPTSEGWTGALDAVGVRAAVVFRSDLLATFCAGTPDPDGYAVVAGTGASAIRVIGGAVDGTADGLGWLLGDGGSGFWIGHRTVRAALAHLDGRAPGTELSELLLEALGIARDGGERRDGRPAALRLAVDALYRIRPVELSRFAALALGAADHGDPAATAIVDGARRRLVRSLSAVHLTGHHGPVVLGGGIARRLPGFAAAVADEVRSWMTDGPAAGGDPEVVMVEDGTVGAGVLALRDAGIAVDRSAFDRLSETLAVVRGPR
jgi:N-acetylglucosamine kinase-like BadF-type ATPase